MSTNLHLKQLAERSRKTVNSIVKQDLPPIERNLEQIEKQSRKLADKVVRPGEIAERKAPYFLASIGIDGDKLSQEIKSINVFDAFEPRVILSDTDIEKFLDLKNQQAITTLIKDGYTQAIDDYNTLYDQNLIKEWDKTKRKVFEELGQFNSPKSNTFNLDYGISNMSISNQIKQPYTPVTDRQAILKTKSAINLNQRHMVCFDVVVKLNNLRLSNYKYGLINEFLEAAKKISADQNKNFFDCWRALLFIVGEHNVIEGRFTRNSLSQHHFSQAYEAPPQDLAHKKLSMAFVNGARQYLEEMYRIWARNLIDSFRNEATVGGQPSAIAISLGVLRVIHRPNGEDNIPIWGLIYVLIRQGYYNEAMEVMEKFAKNFLAEDLTFLTNFKQFISNDNSLPSIERQKFIAEIKLKTKLIVQSQDPYKSLIYQIVAQLEELPQKPQTHTLGCIREIESIHGGVNDVVTLSSFQNEILSFGPKHFTSNGRNPIKYFYALLLSLQFERALDYLCQTEYVVEAVHFAIALAYYGLLRIPEDGEALSLFFEKKESVNHVVTKFNFNMLIIQYVHTLIRDYDNVAIHAFHYLLLLYLYGDPNNDRGRYQIEISHDQMRNLVFVTNSVGELIGDAQQKEGLMKKFMKLMFIRNEGEFKEKIINILANQFYDDGKYNSARRLHEITENYEECVILLNKMLAEYIWISICRLTLQSDTSIQLNPKEIARISKEYDQKQYTKNVSHNLINDNKTLLKLVDFVEYYKKHDYERALSCIKILDLFPFEDDINIIKQKAIEIDDIDESLKKSIAELLYTTMKCIFHRQQYLKDQLSHGTPGAKTIYGDELSELQRNAKTIITFAGYVSNSVVMSDIYYKLNELEVQMR
ncbi:16491_t:CDS:10 [Entrophospora sp. SA101]|nr:16491_t:CDS:10 [Entrophospora sp. SA101]